MDQLLDRRGTAKRGTDQFYIRTADDSESSDDWFTFQAGPELCNRCNYIFSEMCRAD